MSRARLNPRVVALDPPPIPTVQRAARRYGGRHGPPIDLSQAVPGYPAPAALLEALGECAADPATLGYGPIEGERELREAYARDLAARRGAPISAEEILITAGCNQAFLVAAIAVAGAGDAILLPAPFYFNHATTLAMLGIEVRTFAREAQAGFVPDPEALSRAIGPDVRAVALVSPDNPTGCVCPPDRLEAILDVCVERDVWLLLDETYADFLPAGQGRAHALFSRAGDAPWQDRLIGLASFSKSFCLPGHRLGAIAAGAETVAEIAKVVDNVQICAPRAAQAALARALPHLDGWRAGNRREIARRAAAMREALASLPGWELVSIGAFFAYVRHPFAGERAERVAARLAERAGVVALPGSFFGAGQDAFLRLAFANVDARTIERLPARLRAVEDPPAPRPR